VLEGQQSVVPDRCLTIALRLSLLASRFAYARPQAEVGPTTASARTGLKADISGITFVHLVLAGPFPEAVAQGGVQVNA
jgi:hypothetical protein